MYSAISRPSVVTGSPDRAGASTSGGIAVLGIALRQRRRAGRGRGIGELVVCAADRSVAADPVLLVVAVGLAVAVLLVVARPVVRVVVLLFVDLPRPRVHGRTDPGCRRPLGRVPWDLDPVADAPREVLPDALGVDLHRRAAAAVPFPRPDA